MGGEGGSKDVAGEEVGVVLLLFRSTSRLRTWLVGVLQIIQPCRRQGEFLVHALRFLARGLGVVSRNSILLERLNDLHLVLGW